MRKGFLSYVFAPLIAALSFSVSASPVTVTPLATVAQTTTVQPKTNLNTADASTLQRELNGIGQAKAQAIVAYREANGPFQSVDELLEIKGIGNALMERNRDRLTLE